MWSLSRPRIRALAVGIVDTQEAAKRDGRHRKFEWLELWTFALWQRFVVLRFHACVQVFSTLSFQVGVDGTFLNV